MNFKHLLLIGVVATSACSTINNLLDNDNGIDYKSSKSAQKLEVPPDLTQLRTTDRFNTAQLRTQQSRALLDFLAQNVRSDNNNAYSVLLKQELETIRRQGIRRAKPCWGIAKRSPSMAKVSPVSLPANGNRIGMPPWRRISSTRRRYKAAVSPD